MNKEQRVELRQKLERQYKDISKGGVSSSSGLDVVTGLCLLNDLDKADATNARLSKTEVDLNRWCGLHRAQVTDLQKALRNLMNAEAPSEYAKARSEAITVLEETDS